MILGVGIDLTPAERIARALARHAGRFEARVFTDGERRYCAGKARPAEHYAARFAAKEAMLKALGVPDGLSWHEMEVVPSERGRPDLVLRGAAEQAARRLGVTKVWLTLTHAGGLAAAVVVLEGAPTPTPTPTDD